MTSGFASWEQTRPARPAFYAQPTKPVQVRCAMCSEGRDFALRLPPHPASRLSSRHRLVVGAIPSQCLRIILGRRIFAGCRQSLLRDGPFPTLSLRSWRGCSDPYPAALPGCTYPLLHRGHRSQPNLDGFDARISPHMAASVGTSLSRLQSFDHLRAPALARPPGCSHRSDAAAGGRAVHTTHRPAGYPDRDVALLHARHERSAWLDSCQLDRSLVGCSLKLRYRTLPFPSFMPVVRRFRGSRLSQACFVN